METTTLILDKLPEMPDCHNWYDEYGIRWHWPKEPSIKDLWDDVLVRGTIAYSGHHMQTRLPKLGALAGPNKSLAGKAPITEQTIKEHPLYSATAQSVLEQFKQVLRKQSLL